MLKAFSLQGLRIVPVLVRHGAMYLLLCGTILGCNLFGQDDSGRTVSNAQIAKTIEALKAGDINALQDAANSGNREFVPILREQLRDRKAAFHGEVTTIQLGLAKAGEREQLQQIRCELEFGKSFPIQYNAFEKTKSVGGWFAIQTLSRFLADDPRFKKIWSDTGGTYASWQDYALMALPHLVPNSPLPPLSPIVDHSKEIELWESYLQTHQDSLSGLLPTGEGVVSSEEVCEPVLKQDPSIRRKAARQSRKQASLSEN